MFKEIVCLLLGHKFGGPTWKKIEVKSTSGELLDLVEEKCGRCNELIRNWYPTEIMMEDDNE